MVLRTSMVFGRFRPGSGARLLNRCFLAHRFFGLTRGGPQGLPGGPRKSPKLQQTALGGLPRASGVPGARVKKNKNPYFLQGLIERPRGGGGNTL